MSPLAKVPIGSRCRVAAVSGADSIAQRLMEMGLVEGAELQVVKLAPLGDPIQITVLGYHLTLRKTEAARVQVTL
jgi:Fe2+ transport system protein FeoA